MRKLLFLLPLLLLVSCVVPTPPVSPLPTPLPSPLLPERVRSQSGVPGVGIEIPILGGEEMPEVPGLVTVIQLLAAGVVGGIISFLFERFKFFQNLSSDQRWWLILGLSVGLPLAAQFALQFVPAEAWAALEPYWRSVALGFAAWLASQMAHKKFKLP